MLHHSWPVGEPMLACNTKQDGQTENIMPHGGAFNAV